MEGSAEGVAHVCDLLADGTVRILSTVALLRQPDGWRLKRQQDLDPSLFLSPAAAVGLPLDSRRAPRQSSTTRVPLASKHSDSAEIALFQTRAPPRPKKSIPKTQQLLSARRRHATRHR